MVRIVLIRPGSTDFDEQGRIKGNLDIPLNRQGNGQVSRAAAELSDLPIEVVYCSPGKSAEQTAELIAEQLDIKTKKIEKLRNLDHGLWQGKLIEEVKTKQRKIYRRWQEQPETVCPPEGEMLGSAQQRVQSAMEKLLKRHKAGVLAVVAPEPMASLVRCYLSQQELGDLWKAECECGCWEVIDVVPGAPVAS